MGGTHMAPDTQVHTVERKIGEPVFRFETGRLAEQADGAVLAQVGETTVLVAATASRGAREGVDFFPLTVDVEERMYAAGKIPGGFFRREGRPTERAILTARLIDRPLRPCFPDGFRNEVHVVATVMTVDQANQPDIVAINGASAALMLSGIPFEGPVGAVRLAHIEGRWVPNPTFQEIENATFEIIVVGRRNEDGGAGILMVEAGATEIALDLVEAGAPEMSEELVAEGLEEAKTWILEAIAHQEELVAQAGRRTPNKTWVIAAPYDAVLSDMVSSNARDRIVALISEADKQTRESGLDELSAEVVAGLEAEFPDRAREIDGVFRKQVKALVRERIVNDGKRIDGRGLRDIRPISCEVGILPRLHGTGLFNRGQTQVLSTVTLGMLRMEQMLDDLGVAESKRYMHHYNFPPFSTGETGFMRGPKRREIGHGALAERALLPVIPSEMDFPYAIRVVSEVLSSNGSTSMASVCGSTLALMDAGVPIKEPVAGIAMGLIAEQGKFVTLTDIQDDGTVRIGSKEGGSADEARRRIEELANPRMPQIGERFNGIVVKTAPFGAFVSLTPSKDGLVHISKLGGNIRLRRVEDVINQGDAREVEVTDIDPMGKISLAPVVLPPRVAELPADYAQGEPRDRGGDRGDRGGRGGDRGRGGPRGPRREGSREGGRDRERAPRSEGE